MKAEEKFPNVARELKLRDRMWKKRSGNPESDELRELLVFWDAHQWQPIETAPKDVNNLRLWDMGEFIGQWNAWMNAWTDFDANRQRPSHWLPPTKGPQ